jgi:hypothetical protein
MIQRMSEEKMFYVMNIFQNLEGMQTNTLSCGDVCHFEKWHYRIMMKL